jgi:hypothetical protein
VHIHYINLLAFACWKLLVSISRIFTGSTEGNAQVVKKGSQDMELILVTGATGGVGKRVVDCLRKKGLSVRALVSILYYAEGTLFIFSSNISICLLVFQNGIFFVAGSEC